MCAPVAALRELTATGIIHASPAPGGALLEDPMQRTARFALVVLVAALVAACATSPTGRKQLMLVSEQQAISASRQAYVQEIGKAKQDGKLVTDPRLLNRIEVITERLVAQAVKMRPDTARWEWSVQVIDEPKTVN